MAQGHVQQKRIGMKKTNFSDMAKALRMVGFEGAQYVEAHAHLRDIRLDACPFCGESSKGSGKFSINPAKAVYHCHGCSRGGDAIDMLCELGRMSKRQAFDALGHGSGWAEKHTFYTPARRQQKAPEKPLTRYEECDARRRVELCQANPGAGLSGYIYKLAAAGRAAGMGEPDAAAAVRAYWLGFEAGLTYFHFVDIDRAVQYAKKANYTPDNGKKRNIWHDGYTSERFTLFGEHLLWGGVLAIVHESEKTAIVASMFWPASEDGQMVVHLAMGGTGNAPKACERIEAIRQRFDFDAAIMPDSGDAQAKVRAVVEAHNEGGGDVGFVDVLDGLGSNLDYVDWLESKVF